MTTESSESTGPSVATNTASIALTRGKSHTPDDLLAEYEAEASTAESEISKEVEKQAAVQEALPKKILANQVVKKLEEASSQETKIPTEEDASQTKENEDGLRKEEEGRQEEGPVEPKKLKAKFGNDDLEIPEEAVLVSKIYGKDVEYKVVDAVKAYENRHKFERDANRRINDIVSRERAYVKDLDNVKKKASEISTLFSKGDVLPAIKMLARMAAGANGMNEVEYEKQAIESLEKMRAAYSSMNEEQRKVYWAERRAEIAQKELDRKNQEQSRSAALSQLESDIKTAQKSAGMSEEQFWGHYEWLVKNAVGEGKRYPDANEITPQDIAKLHQQVQLSNRIDAALKAVEPALINDEDFLGVLDSVIGERFDLTQEDIETIVRTARGTPSKSVENLNRKVEQANSRGLRSQLSKVSSAKKESSAEDEELYNEWFNKRPVVRR